MTPVFATSVGITGFRVYGLPVAQGSVRAFLVKGRPVVTHDSAKVRPWRQDIAATARAAGMVAVVSGPMRVTATFWLPRPSSRRKSDLYPDRRPDLDKLGRALLDALTGIAFADDAQVVQLLVQKCYATEADPQGAWVTVTPVSAE